MARPPKIPKGLKSSISRLERRAAQKAKVAARKREIEALRKKKEALRKKLNG